MQNGRDALVASAYGTWNNVEHRGHPIQRHAQRAFDGARSRQARPSRAIIPEETNGRDALVASACGTWNTGDIPFSATRRGRSMGHGRDKRDPPARRCRSTGHGRDKRDPPARRCRSMGHGRDKRDPPARPSRRRQREGRACRVRLRNVEHRGHPIQRRAPVPFDGARSRQARPARAPVPFDGARSRQARPSRATIPEETTGGTRLSRPPTERGVRPRNPPGETSRDPPRGKNKARREHASGRTGLAEGGGFEPPIR